MEGLVLELLAYAARLHAPGLQQHSSAPGWLTRAREYLHQYFDCSIKISELAELVGVHPVHLARVFRERYGQSPGEYLRQVRLNWAKTQMHCTDAPLKHIASQAGFADQSHFTRTFKRHMGQTPSAYRRTIR